MYLYSTRYTWPVPLKFKETQPVNYPQAFFPLKPAVEIPFKPSMFTNVTLAAIFAYAAFMWNNIPSHHKKLPWINNPMLQRRCKFLPFLYM